MEYSKETGPDGPMETLKEIRQNIGLTQEQAANRLMVCERAYRRYEAGDRTPTGLIALRMQRLFGVSAAELEEALKSAARVRDTDSGSTRGMAV